jgi:hypothetical protein
MTAMGVVPSFNEVKDRQAGFGLRLETSSFEQLTFQGGEKTFAHGIIETVAHRTHRGPHAGQLTAFTESQ